VVLGAVGLAAYHPPNQYRAGSPSTTPAFTVTYGYTAVHSEYVDYRLRASKWLDSANLVGASLGLGAGLALAPRWELDWHDAAYGVVLGGEAAWVGTFLPQALEIDDQDLKGTVRLPWNGAVAAGLALSELRQVPYRQTAVTAWGALTGNAIGAGIPLLADADPATTTRVMIPVGLAGTVGAYFADPLVEPSRGDAVMIGMGATVGTVEGVVLGTAIEDLQDRWSSTQTAGLTALGGGLTGAGLLALSPVVDPAPDEMVVLGTAAAWGGYYGALIPVALGGEGDPAGVLLPSAITALVGMGGAGVAMLPSVGLEPRDTLVPQLTALSGGTVGALGAGLFTPDPSAVAGGSLIGSTLGFGAGALVEVVRARSGGADLRLPVVRIGRVPGVWSPWIAPSPGPEGAVTVVGIRADAF
jgi:hypothetical protein